MEFTHCSYVAIIIILASISKFLIFEFSACMALCVSLNPVSSFSLLLVTFKGVFTVRIRWRYHIPVFILARPLQNALMR